MKVKELIELLRKENPEATVLLSSDEEGNEYELLDYSFYNGNFDKEKGSPLAIANSIYHSEPEKLSGDYVILYPL